MREQDRQDRSRHRPSQTPGSKGKSPSRLMQAVRLAFRGITSKGRKPICRVGIWCWRRQINPARSTGGCAPRENPRGNPNREGKTRGDCVETPPTVSDLVSFSPEVRRAIHPPDTNQGCGELWSQRRLATTRSKGNSSRADHWIGFNLVA